MKRTELTNIDVNEILKNNKYTMEYVNFQNNSINGVNYKKGQKYFFKIMTIERCIQEFNGYIKIKNEYPVPKLIEFIERSNMGILEYAYDDSIGENKGLLHDFIIKCEKEHKSGKDVINNIFKYYDNSLKRLRKVSSYPMQEFYDKRINSRLMMWYKDCEYYEYEIIINGKIIISLEAIIKKLINFFYDEKEYLAFFSQGDPNTLNIGVKPIFMDLTTAGCNYVVAEVAAFVWSELVADAYFNPKYHAKSYNNHEEVFNIYEKYKPDLRYLIDKDKKTIYIDGKLKTSKVRKEILYQYFDIFIRNNIKIKSEIKYYIIMRILCIFNVCKMEEIDIMYSFLWIGIFYNMLEDDENVLDTMKEIFKEFMEEVELKSGEAISRL